MAVIDYKFVYRDGGANAAPLQTFRFADTLAELGTGLRNGDLGYNNASGPDNRLYMWVNGIWYKLALVGQSTDIPPTFNGGTITNPLNIYASYNSFNIKTGSFIRQARIGTEGSGSYFSNNLYGLWGRDDTAYPGLMLYIDLAGFHFFATQANDNNPIVKAKIDLNGKHYERSRAVAQGDLITIPYSSGNYVADSGGTFTASSGSGAYSLVGQTCHYAFEFEGTVSGAVPAIRHYFPLTFNYHAWNLCRIANPGWAVGIIRTYWTSNLILLYNINGTNFNPGYLNFTGEVTCFV
jgi:hypothetical protein